MAFGYLMLAGSLVVLVFYVHMAGQSLRVAGIIDLVGDHLHTEIARLFPPDDAPVADDHVFTAPDAGVVVVVDVAGLVELARRADDRIEMVAAMGDFVPRDGPLARCVGSAASRRDDFARRVTLDNERSHIGDAAYGLRKLVDIAERSIASSAFNDPVTSVQAIDRLHDAVRQLCFRRLPDGLHHDASGVLRLITRELTWHGYVSVAFGELVELAASAPVVARRLLAAFDDLIAVAPPERRAPLQAYRARLLDGDADDQIPRIPDVQGIGAGKDVLVDN